MAGTSLLRGARLILARLPSFKMAGVPDAPALPIRDPWPGDAARGARLMRGELEVGAAGRRLQPGLWADQSGSPLTRAAAHAFTWLRDLRALGTDGARLRARQLLADWISTPHLDPIATRPDVSGARIAAWLGQFDFIAASADDQFRHRLMTRLVADARTLAARLPTEEMDARALTALKGLVAAAVALPEHNHLLTRALRFLPQEISRQVLPDGTHAERSPAAQMAALQDLTEIRALLQAAQVPPPAALTTAIDRLAPALRVLRHADNGLALFNGSREESPNLIDLVLAQAGRGGRAPSSLTEGGFYRLQAGRTLLLVDAGAPPGPGLDRTSHAGTLSFEMSVGRDRVIVNCGAAPAAGDDWQDAVRATAAHSTVTISDTNSAELRLGGLGRRPETVEAHRQEANGAHWLDISHDGYRLPFEATHYRRLYVSESGEDVRGEDAIDAPAGVSYSIRFHLHPSVTATLETDPDAVLLRLHSGAFWRLRADGVRPALEDSLYLGGTEPRPSRQVVLCAEADGPQQIKWAISRMG